MKYWMMLLVALLLVGCEQNVDVKQRVTVVGKTDTTNTTTVYNGDIEIPGDITPVRILLCKQHGVYQYTDELHLRCEQIRNSTTLRDCVIRRYSLSQYTIVKYVRPAEDREQEVGYVTFYAYLKEKVN